MIPGLDLDIAPVLPLRLHRFGVFFSLYTVDILLGSPFQRVYFAGASGGWKNDRKV
jgi:hypothetical protein